MTKTKIKVAVIGASGYTGGELLRLLSGHPHVSIALTISSEKSAGRALTELFPNLTSILALPLESMEPAAVAKQVDLVFLALPHTQSIPMVATFLECGKSVIDLSADFRLKASKVYEQWYGTAHTAPHLLQPVRHCLDHFSYYIRSGNPSEFRLVHFISDIDLCISPNIAHTADALQRS